MSEPRILIAEDERIVAEDIKRTLERFGYEISSIASSGEEAVKKAQEEEPDLILMDIVLKGELDGIEAAQQIYERLNIPVVFLTAYADEGTLARAKIIEPYGYVVKPFEDRALRVAVEMALSKYEMEIRVKESEQFSSSLLTNALNPIIVINPDTSVRYVNPALERLTGFSAKEVIGVKAPYPWWTKETLRKTKRDLKKEMSRGVQRFEEIFKKKSGERFWVEITAQPVKENGHFNYYLANWVDITERRQVNESLKQLERELTLKNKIAHIFLTIPDEEMYGEVLNVILEAMESKYGVFGYIDEAGALVCSSMTRGIWDQCQVSDKDIVFPREIWGGIWGKALIEKKSLYSNEHFSVPQGHIPIFRALDVPIILQREVIGNLLVANKSTDYDEKDQELLETIANHIAPILDARLQRDKQKSDRTLAEEALRDSKEKYRDLVENINDVIYSVDKDGVITYISPAIESILGYRPQEIVGRHFTELVYAEDLPRQRECFRKAYSGPIGADEYRVLSKSGEHHWLRISSRPILEKNIAVGLRGALADITEKKDVENALKRREQELRMITDNIPGLVLYVDADGYYRFVNKKYEEWFGISREQIIGKHYRPVLGDKIYALIKNHVQAALSGKPVHYVEALPYKSMVTRWVEANYVPDIDENGKVKGFFALVIDITEREKAGKALRESEAQKKAILDASIDRIRLSDTEMRIVWANQRHTKELDKVPEFLIGKYCYRVFANRDTPCPDCPGIKALKSGRAEHAVLVRQHMGSEGEKRYLDAYAAPIKDGTGEIVNILNITRDITEQRKAEEEKEKLESQLLHAQKMEAVGTLAGGIAHDFNNLLMGILGYTSLMLMDVDHTHPHYERLQGIENQVQSGADLTRQLLGFARGGKYEVKPTDLNEIVKKTSSMFSRTKKEINIHRKYQKDLWPIEADQGQIEQVLLNLYVNAWQAMHGEGELYLETQNVTLDEEYVKPYQVEPGRYAKISITDTGIGMDESTRQRIFEPFFTTKEMGRGTGLGLASAYGIIKNHGGCINVYSEKGKGATFTIYLPASDKEAVKEEELPEKVLKGTETVLLVDDEEVVIAIGEKMLKTLGYEVLVARTGKEAIDIVSKAHRAKRKAEEGKESSLVGPSTMPPEPDLVILDMIMPEMGGGGVYDQIKEINPKVKVLLSSGYGIEGQAREILERGCNGFIQKPFDTRKLSRKIREVLEQDD